MSRRTGWSIRAAGGGSDTVRAHRRRVPVALLPALLAVLAAGTALSGAATYSSGFAGKAKYEEYEVRTAFLLVFAKYTEWPENVLPPGSPLIIGVLGEVPLGSLHDSLAATNINGRKVVIKRFRNPSEIQPCNILYFPADQEHLLPKLRVQLAASSVLTVGETSLFIGFGGALQLFSEEGRLRFTVNRAILDQSRIRVEAKALVLAKQIFNQSAEAQE